MELPTLSDAEIDAITSGPEAAKLAERVGRLFNVNCDESCTHDHAADKPLLMLSERHNPRKIWPADADSELNRMAAGSYNMSRDVPKQGRNEKCACGSGRKYKKCCIKK